MTSPWLRSKPSDWRLGRLKDLVESCRNGTWGDEPQFDGDGVRTIRVADFDWAHLIVTHPVPTRRLVDRHQLERVGLANGDLILEKSGGGQNQPVGRAVRFQGDGQAVCSNFTARVRPSSAAEPRYLCYSFAAAYWAGINQRSIKQTTGIQNLDSRAYLAEAWAYPSVADQRKIADFLDRETARIDELVDTKKRFIELLEEKRTSAIVQAVTKGLDPSVRMKNLGIPWLGEIPAHWERRPLKSLVDFRKGKDAQRITAEFIGANLGPYPVFSGQTENAGLMGSIDSYDFDAPEGVILVTTVGKVGTTRILDGRFSLSQNCALMTPKTDDVNLRFLRYQLDPLFSYEASRVPMSAGTLVTSD